MVRDLQGSNLTEKAVEDYMSMLEALLDRKQFLIGQLQDKMVAYEEAKAESE